MKLRNLLTLGNPKTAKGEGFGFLTAILHLAPFTLGGFGNICVFATRACVALCLNTAGRGGIIPKGKRTNVIQRARKRKTREFFKFRALFLATLAREIRNHVKRAAKHGLRAAVRLNGTSDLNWESLAPSLFSEFPDVIWYDYTKNPRRMRDYLAGGFPANYSLTFSRSETNETESLEILRAGGNVAVVFSTKRGASLPDSWNGFPVIDGDISDLRFTDPRAVVVGLRAKGKARKDTTSGFVVQVSPSVNVRNAKDRSAA